MLTCPWRPESRNINTQRLGWVADSPGASLAHKIGWARLSSARSSAWSLSTLWNNANVRTKLWGQRSNWSSGKHSALLTQDKMDVIAKTLWEGSSSLGYTFSLAKGPSSFLSEKISSCPESQYINIPWEITGTFKDEYSSNIVIHVAWVKGWMDGWIDEWMTGDSGFITD